MESYGALLAAVHPQATYHLTTHITGQHDCEDEPASFLLVSQELMLQHYFMAELSSCNELDVLQRGQVLEGG